MTDSGLEPGWAELNRLSWDERVPIHVSSDFYDVEGFKSGTPAVQPFEVEELGALGGLRLAHLQCHFGQDMLDLVRLHPTLEAVGLDFSEPAVEAARALAAELHLDARATFVHSDVRHAARVLGEGGFDVVYTGKGAICWLPDLRQWAEQCAALLRPGGFLYLCEFHPVGYALGSQQMTVEYDYFTEEPFVDDEAGSYADPRAVTKHNVTYSWSHPLYRVFDALLGAGLELRFFHEWDHTLFEYATWLVRGDDGRYRWPGPGKLPLMYSLKAEKRPR
jgi:SAM-dependent methyltransferase